MGGNLIPKIILHTTLPLIRYRLFFSILGENCGLERKGYDLKDIETDDEVHLIYSLVFPPRIHARLRARENIFWMENGWFTQTTGFTIDPYGTNSLSSLRNTNLARDPRVSDNFMDEWVERLHGENQVGTDITNERDYIFIPLQVEKDTQLLYWSGCDAAYPHRLLWFVEQVLQAYPNDRLIFRPHPRDKETGERIANSDAFLAHPRASIISTGTSYQWIKHAKAVIGINSTVLLEALTFPTVPILAFGTGLFSENGVFLEARGDLNRLKTTFSHIPDSTLRRWFLSLLIQRHIPYNTDFKNDVSFYPELEKLIKMTKEPIYA